jgi:hypothetical protein
MILIVITSAFWKKARQKQRLAVPALINARSLRSLSIYTEKN